MNSKKTVTSLVTLSLCIGMGAASLTQTAHAEGHISRHECKSGAFESTMGHGMGRRNGGSLVRRVWQRLGGTCDKLDQLAQVISESPLAKPVRSGRFAACFYMGFVDTVWEEVEKIYDDCGNKCFDAGTQIGNISAQGYCAASIAVAGLLDPGFIAQPPLPFCGTNVVLGCKSEYVRVATSDYPGCYAYTEGSYREAFDNTVRQDCYVPTDVPIRTGGQNWMTEIYGTDQTELM